MRVVSFFSGIGGLDKGFEEAGYSVISMQYRHIKQTMKMR